MPALLAIILASSNSINSYSAIDTPNPSLADSLLSKGTSYALTCGTVPTAKAADSNRLIDYRCLTVQVVNGEQKGSGVLIKGANERILVVTNRHVVIGSTNVCVTFHDRRRLNGMVYSNEKSSNDVAFILVPSLSSLMPHALPATTYDPHSIEPVISSGYQAMTNKYTQTNGLTIPIIPGKRLQSGYSITYTNSIEKGMSGGGIFAIDGSLLGINAIHSEPLWEGFWIDSTGNPVEERISRKLDHVSVGVDSQTILAELEKLSIAAPETSEPIACKT